MATHTKFSTTLLIGLGACLLPGCASYYKVTDLQNGGEYYTRDVDEAGDGGAIRFRDERTGSLVTLPTSKVRQISRDRYEEGLKEGK